MKPFCTVKHFKQVISLEKYAVLQVFHPRTICISCGKPLQMVFAYIQIGHFFGFSSTLLLFDAFGAKVYLAYFFSYTLWIAILGVKIQTLILI